MGITIDVRYFETSPPLGKPNVLDGCPLNAMNQLSHMVRDMRALSCSSIDIRIYHINLHKDILYLYKDILYQYPLSEEIMVA